jgi:hypothetical protein
VAESDIRTLVPPAVPCLLARECLKARWRQEIIINELLFFVQNKFGCKPISVLQGILVSFYSEQFICSSKKMLYDISVRLLGDKAVGKYKDRRPGDNKKRLDIQDLLELYTRLDKEKAAIPLFVAASLAKIPGDSPAECDVSVFAVSLSDLKAQVNDLHRAFESFSSSSNKPGASNKESLRAADAAFIHKVNGGQLVVDLGQNSSDVRGDAASVKNDDVDSSDENEDAVLAGSSFARVAGRNNCKWNTVGKSLPKKKTACRAKATRDTIYGSKDTSNMVAKLKAVQAERPWHCKISRIGEEYTMDDVHQYMRESGVEPMAVELLPRRDDAPLSMHLVIPYDGKDKVMQHAFWPKGIRVGGWHFARKSNRERHA